jgi:alpha-L-fucosidase
VNEAPEWFRDAKFGIYFHWGVYSVPAFGSEWYPRNMHDPDHSVHDHHVETYGTPVEHPYTRFVPQFTAEHFDAARWADLFKKAGARYAGPVAEHHDGYSLWASEVTPWNAADTGPNRDLVGELERAIRDRGLRFVTTFHHARNSLHRTDGEWTGHYGTAKRNYPEVLEDPKQAWMYGAMDRSQFLDMWLAKLAEVSTLYRPDLIWFDSWLHEIPDSSLQQFLASYYNWAEHWEQEAVVTRKQDDLPLEVSVKDFEKGQATDITDRPFLTDDTISTGSWCYTKGLELKSEARVLHSFLDIVSKNGCLLLNISPKADGTIPPNQRKLLLSIGEWLDANGEAVYETRPWRVFGEGPTQFKEGEFGGVTAPTMTAQDIRYTRSKDGRTLYALAMGWPEDALTLTAVAPKTADSGTVRLPANGERLDHSLNEKNQLVVEVPRRSPEERPGQHAYVFEIRGMSPRLHDSHQ